MVKFRNIKVKMKGGKTRIQRAMVLASGKLRFVKNIHKYQVWKIGHKSKSRGSAPRHKTTKTKHHRGGIHTTKKGHHRGGGGIMPAVKKIAMVGAGLAPIVRAATYPGSAQSKLDYGLSLYTGYSFMDNAWHIDRAISTYGPMAAVPIGFKLVSFVNKLFRRL